MGKKILFCASTVSHIMNFHLRYLKAFHEKGYEVWVAANEQKPIPYADFVVALPIKKKFASFQNINAIFIIRKLIKAQNFEMISTHTTLASAIARAAVLLLRKKPKVFCTVHGYLFNENGGFKKWFYLLPEKICAPITNVLMVMNHEDYEIANKHKLYKDKLYYINGMGIDLTKFKPTTPEERVSVRKTLKISEDDFVYVYTAEFSTRKNQEFLIRAFADVCKANPKMMLLLAGNGVLLDGCKNLVDRLGIGCQVRFMGYVNNISKLYAACDVYVTVSKIEGLPFNVMEAMASGLSVIASDIKGHRELMEESKALFPLEDYNSLKRLMLTAFSNPEGFEKKIDLSRFGIETVLPQIMRIYLKGDCEWNMN